MIMTSDTTTVEIRQVDSIQLSPLRGDGEGGFVRVLRITYEGGKVLEHVLLEENPDALEVVESPEVLTQHEWIEEA